MQTLTQERTKDSHVFGCWSFDRKWLLFSAFLIQMCLGTKYGWSIYSNGLQSIFHRSFDDALGIMILFVGIANCVGGPFIARNGPRRVAFVGTLLFFVGHVLCGLAVYFKQYWMVYVGYSCIAGFGVGLTFLCPILTLQKYYPDKRGLASGVSVGGYGLGVVLGSLTQKNMIDKIGIQNTFFFLAIFYVFVQLSAVSILRYPSSNIPSHHGEVKKDFHNHVGPEHAKFINLRSVLSHYSYWMFYIVVMCEKLCGIVMFSKASKTLRKTWIEFNTEWFVALLGVANFTGRITFGFLCDYVKPSILYTSTVFLQIIFLTCVYFTQHLQIEFVVSVFFLVCLYGAGFGMLAVFLIELFGADRIGEVLGITMTAFALDGLIAGLLSKDEIPYNFLFGFLLVGSIVVCCLRFHLIYRK